MSERIHLFHVTPVFPSLQAAVPCSTPGCNRQAAYMSATRSKEDADKWRAHFLCREHFEEIKRDR